MLQKWEQLPSGGKRKQKKIVKLLASLDYNEQVYTTIILITGKIYSLY
jgi:hypothetical protein